MDVIIYAASACAYTFLCIYTGKKQLHMAQLEGYKPRQYWWWIKRNLRALFLKETIPVFLAALLFAAAYLTRFIAFFGYASFAVWAAACGSIVYRDMTQDREVKKPLVFTHRAIRLFALYLVLAAALAAVSYLNSENLGVFVLLLASVKLIMPFNMLLAASVIYPLEMAHQYRYFRSAQIKISGMKNLRVIGITGSYGKTSTKYFIKTILSEKYNTLMTPESYNTPMGITRVIRENLTEEHEVFVCEMGARNQGEIKTLCRLVNPEIGILTSVGPQHLEMFKTMENIAKTKYELIQALPYNGTAIFNGDNNYCLAMARRTGIETLVYNIDGRYDETYIYAEEIKNTRDGLKFKVKGLEELSLECSAPVLGKHNVSNLLAAISTALTLGLTPSEIEAGVSKIKPVPHRLQILDNENGVTVIDDAFNSNPAGAREALEVIKGFEGCSRIVVTPGMVELGAVEYAENKKMGRLMARSCDYAVLVGAKRSVPLAEGLKEEDFPSDRIIITSSLREATRRLEKIARPGDVVLFENDLPDNYNEL